MELYEQNIDRMQVAALSSRLAMQNIEREKKKIEVSPTFLQLEVWFRIFQKYFLKIFQVKFDMKLKI